MNPVILGASAIAVAAILASLYVIFGPDPWDDDLEPADREAFEAMVRQMRRDDH